MSDLLQFNPELFKVCPDCREEKAVTEFSRNAARPDGFASYCKTCRKRQGRADYLRRTFALTDADVSRMIAAQGGLCAICRDAAPQHIDHDHRTGRVRGVLCGPCNMGLGLFADDVNRLKAAIGYLEPAYRRLAATMHAVEAPRCCVIEVGGALHRAA